MRMTPCTLKVGSSTIDGYNLFRLVRLLLTHSTQGKGKKVKKTMRLVVLLPDSLQHKLISDFSQPSGEPATVKWITVGGRTSAYVSEVQKHHLKQKNRGEPLEVLLPTT